MFINSKCMETEEIYSVGVESPCYCWPLHWLLASSILGPAQQLPSLVHTPRATSCRVTSILAWDSRQHIA